MIRKPPINNEWYQNLLKLTFPVAKKMHGLFLHFKVDGYSYAKYNGGTGYNMSIHSVVPSKNVMQLNALVSKIGDRNLDKFLIINAIAGLKKTSELNGFDATQNYDTWIEALTSKEKFNEKCKILLRPRSTDSARLPSSGRFADCDLDYCLDLVLDCASDYRSGNSGILRLEAAFLAVWLISLNPEIVELAKENVVNELLIGKLSKIKEFTDWWTLT